MIPCAHSVISVRHQFVYVRYIFVVGGFKTDDMLADRLTSVPPIRLLVPISFVSLPTD